MKYDIYLRVYPDPILLQRCNEVDLSNPDLPQIIADVRTVFENTPITGVGFAANQAGVPLRFILVKPTVDDELLVMINPIIKTLTVRGGMELISGIEGCLSFPGVYEQVKRYNEIVVSWVNLEGKEFTGTFVDFPARVIQHEMDHLDGKMFFDRMTRQMRKNCLAQYETLNNAVK